MCTVPELAKAVYGGDQEKAYAFSQLARVDGLVVLLSAADSRTQRQIFLLILKKDWEALLEGRWRNLVSSL